MSSTRFPGKVLAPLNGRPIIAHVISRVAQAIPPDRITVATSTEESDDPLAGYVRDRGISVFRGPLNDVFDRFRLCLAKNPCAWFFRICADSPLLDGAVLRTMLGFCNRTDLDLVTNVFPRTYAKGQSVEMLNAHTFATLDPLRLSAEDREHVTKFYYDHPSEFRITNVTSPRMEPGGTCLVVDTVSDLDHLNRLLSQESESR